MFSALRLAPDEATRELKQVYRLLFRSDLNISQALEAAEAEAKPLPEVKALIGFMQVSARGVGF